MKQLLWKRKTKFIQYLIASFMFNIERFINMGLFALILGAVEKSDKENYKFVVIITIIGCIYMALSYVISRMLRIGYMRDTILDIRKQAFDKIIGMTFKQFSKKSKEVYISNLINDINTFESKFFISLLNFYQYKYVCIKLFMFGIFRANFGSSNVTIFGCSLWNFKIIF